MIQYSFRVAFGFTLLGLTLWGCGSDSSRKARPTVKLPRLEAPRATGSAESLSLRSSSTEPRLLGSWTSPCLADEDGSSSTIALDITGQYFQQTQTLYADANCMEPDLDARYIAFYAADKAGLQSTLVETHVLIHEFSVAKAAEAGSSCGFNRWHADVWYNVTDRACDQGEDGFWVSPTESGIKNSGTYSIHVTGGTTELDLGDGLIVSRPVRIGDKPPSAPGGGFLFANLNAQRVEKFLKNWGCTLSVELGVSNCPDPRNLNEASQLVDHLIEFGNAIGTDGNFANNDAARTRMRKGYDAELAKVRAFPAYAEVLAALQEGVSGLSADYPEFTFSTHYNANALRLLETLKTLQNAFQTPDVVSELRRLNVTVIVLSISRSYYPGEKDVYLWWDDLSTPAQFLAFLKLQTPMVAAPARFMLPRPASKFGAGFKAQTP